MQDSVWTLDQKSSFANAAEPDAGSFLSLLPIAFRFFTSSNDNATVIEGVSPPSSPMDDKATSMQFNDTKFRQRLFSNLLPLWLSPVSLFNTLIMYATSLVTLIILALLLPAFLLRSLTFVAHRAIALLAGDVLSGGSRQSRERLEYWMQRCSICFDAQLDLCLTFCRDQFCEECFKRYVTEVVKSSWGLNVTKIKCPVCQDIIPQAEWSRYVEPHVVEMYNNFNQPFRAFSRYCGECGGEVVAASLNKAEGAEKKKILAEIVRQTSEFFGDLTNKDSLRVCERLAEDCRKHLSHGYYIADIYYTLLPELVRQLGTSMDHTDRLRAASISSKLLALERRPEHWKELQFAHVANFPQTFCSSCDRSICLQCGETTHHSGRTCVEYMQWKASGLTNKIDAESLRWKLDNSRSCPHCSILIHRDDGCNKVDCLHCGYRFCWMCRSAWSENCGFYRCRKSTLEKTSRISEETSSPPNESTAPTNSVDRPEIGVPDVARLQRILPDLPNSDTSTPTLTHSRS
ncbi:uncharacterized protein VTP21DRAFT_9103 [Calcarisporiella thermophila]|uniref:uncharacterized protein n=1 Tax=Calcarisporiella thermophila TaxID=911321 RepID=UPI0037439999